MTDNVIPLYPRNGVTRQVISQKSESAFVRIGATVSLRKLLTGLASQGLQLRHDQRTGEFAILPAEGVQS